MQLVDEKPEDADRFPAYIARGFVKSNMVSFALLSQPSQTLR